jgi:hypothetical protein
MHPNTPLLGTDGLTVQDFWTWAYSDINNNVRRAIFAEFLVFSALELLTLPQPAWKQFDLEYAGLNVEIKTSGSIQVWEQAKPTPISWGVKPKADLHIFCWYREAPSPTANVLNLEGWRFFICPTYILPQHKQRISLKSLETVCGKASLAQPIHYDRLKVSLERVIDRYQDEILSRRT